jgi:DNA-binding response OmpR family regulator
MTAEPQPPVSDSGSGAPRVLVVEDDPTVRAMLSAWLYTEKCEYQVAGDAATARAALAERDFDLLLCDINLPDTDGPDFVATIEGRNRGLPVIFLTGQPTMETAIRSVQLRVAAYLIKPPNLDELRRHVQQSVAKHRERLAVAASRSRLKEWDVELARLERALEGPEAGPTGLDRLRLSLHQLGALLVDLDRSVAAVANESGGKETLRRVEFIASLRHTVQVLEQTRSSFKSKALGELRKELESVLQRVATK